MTEPDHAPVPGSGMPTNSHRPTNATFWMVSDLLSRCFSYQWVRRESIGSVFIQAMSFFPKIRINGIGIILPTMLSSSTLSQGRPNAVPTMTEPRSSISGIMETMNTAPYALMCATRKLNIVLIMCKLLVCGTRCTRRICKI